MKLMGKDYVVWDKSAHIDFIKPGTGTIRSTLIITDEMLDEIKLATADGDKFLPEYPVEIINQAGELVAKVVKTLYIRKNTRS